MPTTYCVLMVLHTMCTGWLCTGRYRGADDMFRFAKKIATENREYSAL